MTNQQSEDAGRANSPDLSNATETKDTSTDRVSETPNLTFGQKAVGITFNPGGNPDVDRCKQMFANCIDQMDSFRKKEGATPGQIRHASTAITMMEDAQMRAVKALTWKD